MNEIAWYEPQVRLRKKSPPLPCGGSALARPRYGRWLQSSLVAFAILAAVGCNRGEVEQPAAKCDSCHGHPPAPPHPAATECNQCHPGTALAPLTLAPGALHSNGKVELDPTRAKCGACHGMPPGGEHPPDPACGDCHGCVADNEMKLFPAGAHLHGDGKVSMESADACPPPGETPQRK